MTTLAEQDRQTLLGDGNDLGLAFDNMHNRWAQSILFDVVAAIVSRHVAEALAPFAELADEWTDVIVPGRLVHDYVFREHADQLRTLLPSPAPTKETP